MNGCMAALNLVRNSNGLDPPGFSRKPALLGQILREFHSFKAQAAEPLEDTLPSRGYVQRRMFCQIHINASRRLPPLKL